MKLDLGPVRSSYVAPTFGTDIMGPLDPALERRLRRPMVVGAAIIGVLVVGLGLWAALTPLALLPPARADGAGAAAGRLDSNALAAAWGSALIIAVALGLVALGLTHALLAALMSGAGAFIMVALARRAIGGQTGDVAGAAQQCGEIAAWCGLLIGHTLA